VSFIGRERKNEGWRRKLAMKQLPCGASLLNCLGQLRLVVSAAFAIDDVQTVQGGIEARHEAAGR
jgi:hypothetical protein